MQPFNVYTSPVKQGDRAGGDSMSLSAKATGQHFRSGDIKTAWGLSEGQATEINLDENIANLLRQYKNL